LRKRGIALSFFEELKRRNVFRVGIAYVLLGWVVLQAADFALDLIDAPNWIIQALFIIGLAGLPIALFFAWAFEMTPEGIKREADVDRSQSIVPQTGRKLDRAIIGFLVVAVLLLLGDRWFSSESTQTPEPAAVAIEETVAAPSQKSIAVLPFVNMSSDEEQEFFSDGISEEILNALAKVDALKVAGRTSSFAFKGRNEDLRSIGETLGVENILEGSVRKSGDRVRITAQLVQVKDGFHLWSETYDRELTDIFAIQDDIANRILAAMKTALAVESISDRPTLNIVDYDKFLLGRQLMRERREAPLERARALFTEVNQSAPDFAPAWAERAVTVMLLQDDLSSYGSIPKAESTALARTFLDRARALDPDSPEMLAGLGLYYDNMSNRPEAIDYLQRALAINPSMANAANWLWRLLYQTGHHQEAVRLNEQNRERDPLYLPTAENISWDYLSLGMEPAMAEHLEKVRVQFAAISDAPVQAAETALAFMRADYAGAVEAQRPAAENRGLLNLMSSLALMQLGEPEWAARVGAGTPGEITALAAMGRLEESKMVAQPKVANGEGIHEFIGALVSNERYAEAIEFFDQRWLSLAAFENQVVVRGLFSGVVLGRLVEALRATGDETRAQAFFDRYGEVLAEMDAEGVDNHWHTFSKAYYATLSGDGDLALEQLAIFADGGHFMPPDFTRQWRSFEFLRGNPRFDVLLTQMTERLNEQRAELDLPAYEEAQRG
jgi:TolB-like protein